MSPTTPGSIAMAYKDKDQQRKFQREWQRKRRADWLAANGPCPCGSADDLEIDHVDPVSKVSHRVWSWSSARRERELAKCQVLCKACHLKKTIAARGGRDHGTASMYRIGCRCEPCHRAHVDAVNEWRWKTERRKKAALV